MKSKNTENDRLTNIFLIINLFTINLMKQLTGPMKQLDKLSNTVVWTFQPVHFILHCEMRFLYISSLRVWASTSQYLLVRVSLWVLTFDNDSDKQWNWIINQAAVMICHHCNKFIGWFVPLRRICNTIFFKCQ